MIDFMHIGLPKAASTWLQTSLFRYHPELQVFTKGHAPQGTEPYQSLVDFRHQPTEEYERAYWQARFERELGKAVIPGKVVGISDEELSNGGILHVIPDLLPRLKDTLGTMKVIIILRHPIQYLRSAYSEYIHKGGTQSLDEFYHPERAERLAARIDFPKLVEDTRALFGEEHVLLLPLEMLKDEGEQTFIDHICEFLGVGTLDISQVPKARRNRGVTRASLPMYKVINRMDDTLVRRVPLYTKRRRIGRVLIKTLDRFPIDASSPKIAAPPRAYIERLPNVEQVLREGRFAFWGGNLAKYNYKLGGYNFE